MAVFTIDALEMTPRRVMTKLPPLSEKAFLGQVLALATLRAGPLTKLTTAGTVRLVIPIFACAVRRV
jgi:hypothetical protein